MKLGLRSPAVVGPRLLGIAGEGCWQIDLDRLGGRAKAADDGTMEARGDVHLANPKLQRVQAGRQPVISRRRLLAAAVWTAVVAWFFVPLPAPEPLQQVETEKGPTPSSCTESYPFQFPADSERATLRVRTDLRQGDVQVELLDATDNLLVRWKPQGGRHSTKWTFSVGKGFRAGIDCRLRVTERDVVGAYNVSFANREGVTRWHRFLALFAVMAVASGSALAWLRLSPRWHAWRGKALWFLWPALVASLGLVYVILHEGGHNFALCFFGALDLGRSDILGLSGSPHGGRLMGATLADWQEAVVAIAGPGVPILIGWALLVLGVTPVGRRIRGRSRLLDSFLSIGTAVFLFTAVALLAQALGVLNPDSDFQGFVEHVALPLWTSKAILAVVGLASSGVSIAMARRLPLLRGTQPSRGAQTEPGA